MRTVLAWLVIVAVAGAVGVVISTWWTMLILGAFNITRHGHGLSFRSCIWPGIALGFGIGSAGWAARR